MSGLKWSTSGPTSLEMDGSFLDAEESISAVTQTNKMLSLILTNRYKLAVSIYGLVQYPCLQTTCSPVVLTVGGFYPQGYGFLSTLLKHRLAYSRTIKWPSCHCWQTAPAEVLDASISTTISPSLRKIPKAGAEVKADFNSSKALSLSAVGTTGTFFRSIALKGSATLVKFGQKLR